jgi:hypothetical protein
MDRSPELAAAIFAALDGHAGLVALLGGPDAKGRNRIYDRPPAGTLPPYVAIGDETANDYGSSSSIGAGDAQVHTLTIHTWSAQPSGLRLRQIMAAVRGALHERPLALAAGRLVYLRQEFKETMHDPDGVTHHGVQRFRALTED